MRAETILVLFAPDALALTNFYDRAEHGRFILISDQGLS